MMTDEGLREQRKARKYGERIGSRVVERACRGSCVQMVRA